MSDTRIFLTGLWVNETRDGRKYMAGKLGLGGRLLVFKNDYKQKETDPDYQVYIVAAEQRDEAQPPTDQDTLPF